MDCAVSAGGEGLVVGDDYESGAHRVAELEKEILQLVAVVAVEASGRLVGEDDFRIVHQGASHGRALAFAAGELGGAVGETLGEAEFRQEGAGALHSLAPGATGDKRRHCHILLYRELGEEAVGLEDEADVGVAEAREGAVAQRFHVLTVVEDASALLGLEESAENLEEGGLPGAGGADNGCNLPGGDVQGDFAKHFKRAEALVYVPCRKHRLTKVQKSCHLSKPLSIFKAFHTWLFHLK